MDKEDLTTLETCIRASTEVNAEVARQLERIVGTQQTIIEHVKQWLNKSDMATERLVGSLTANFISCHTATMEVLREIKAEQNGLRTGQEEVARGIIWAQIFVAVIGVAIIVGELFKR